MTVWSIGHSTHDLAGFPHLLIENGVSQVADVRAVPRSRRHPQFHADALERDLPEFGVAYVRVRELGGSDGRATAPELTPFAQVAPDGRVTYPATEADPG